MVKFWGRFPLWGDPNGRVYFSPRVSLGIPKKRVIPYRVRVARKKLFPHGQVNPWDRLSLMGLEGLFFFLFLKRPNTVKNKPFFFWQNPKNQTKQGCKRAKKKKKEGKGLFFLLGGFGWVAIFLGFFLINFSKNKGARGPRGCLDVFLCGILPGNAGPFLKKQTNKVFKRNNLAIFFFLGLG